MKDETRKRKLAELLGIPYEPPKPPDPKEELRKETVSREAEAVVLYMEDPAKFITRLCRVCHQPFGVNRASISCCSDRCRQDLLSETYGLDVDLSLRTPQERWTHNTGGREPLIVPPPVIKLLAQSLPMSALAELLSPAQRAELRESLLAEQPLEAVS